MLNCHIYDVSQSLVVCLVSLVAIYIFLFLYFCIVFFFPRGRGGHLSLGLLSNLRVV